jgi:hypothetical protein
MPVIDKDGSVGWFAWESGPRDYEWIGIQRTTYPGAVTSSTPKQIADRANKLNDLRAQQRSA